MRHDVDVILTTMLLGQLVMSTIWCSNALLYSVSVTGIHSWFPRLLQPCSNSSGKRTCSLLCTSFESVCV